MEKSFPFRLFINPLDHHTDVHWHEFFELGFVIEGEGRHILNGKPSPLRRGTLFLLTPADFHELTPSPGNTILHYNLIFSEEALDKELHQLLFVPYKENLVCEIPDVEFHMVSAEFERIRTELDFSGRIGTGIIVQGAIERLLIELIRRTDAVPFSQKQYSATHDAIRNAIAYLQLHFREPLSLEDAARQANLSPNYFSKCFKQFTDMTYQYFLQDLRLQFACSLLKVSGLPITEICYASGFNTLPNFERAFKQRFDKTPSLYRSKS